MSPKADRGSLLKGQSDRISHLSQTYGSLNTNFPPASPTTSSQSSRGNMSSESQVRLLGSDGVSHGGHDHNDDDDTASGGRSKSSAGPRSRTMLQILCVAAILVLFATVSWLFYPSAIPSAPHPPEEVRGSIKIMVLGDSITQGHEGDYSWRYRLWQWLRDSDHEDVSFVGPFIGTFPPPDHARPSTWRPLEKAPVLEVRDWGKYAADVDPAWIESGNNAHFAHWGRQAYQFKDLIEDAVRQAQPDYLVLAAGFNDLAWRWWPTELIDIVADLVKSARAAKPDLKIAVSNVVQRKATEEKKQLPTITRMYNAMLEDAIMEWRTEESPVELVRVRESYECDPWSCPASHDGLHPNALGEYQIARAFARTLHDRYGLGSSNFTIPSDIPPRPCPPPSNLRAVVNATAPSSDMIGTTTTVHVAWDSVLSAFDYHIQAQVKGGDWAVLPATVENSFIDEKLSGPGKEWAIRVRSYCGDQQPSSDWTDVTVRT